MIDKETFFNDVANHHATILHDDGVYRHIKFSRHGIAAQSFGLVTWPGALCFTGDMGTYVFERLPDMFDFFRGKIINPDYWAEKVQADDARSGIREYDHNVFSQTMREWAKEIHEDWEAQAKEGSDISGLNEAIECVIRTTNEDLNSAHNAMRDFHYGGWHIWDSDEYDLTTFTSRFIWACHAIVWGVEQYDQCKSRGNFRNWLWLSDALKGKIPLKKLTADEPNHLAIYRMVEEGTQLLGTASHCRYLVNEFCVRGEGDPAYIKELLALYVKFKFSGKHERLSDLVSRFDKLPNLNFEVRVAVINALAQYTSPGGEAYDSHEKEINK